MYQAPLRRMERRLKDAEAASKHRAKSGRVTEASRKENVKTWPGVLETVVAKVKAYRSNKRQKYNRSPSLMYQPNFNGNDSSSDESPPIDDESSIRNAPIDKLVEEWRKDICLSPLKPEKASKAEKEDLRQAIKNARSTSKTDKDNRHQATVNTLKAKAVKKENFESAKIVKASKPLREYFHQVHEEAKSVRNARKRKADDDAASAERSAKRQRGGLLTKAELMAECVSKLGNGSLKRKADDEGDDAEERPRPAKKFCPPVEAGHEIVAKNHIEVSCYSLIRDCWENADIGPRVSNGVRDKACVSPSFQKRAAEVVDQALVALVRVHFPNLLERPRSLQ